MTDSPLWPLLAATALLTAAFAASLRWAVTTW